MRHPTKIMTQKEETENERLRRENAALDRELVRALEKIGKLNYEIESLKRQKIMYPERYYSTKEINGIPSVAQTDWEYVDKIIREMRHYQDMLDQANDIIHRYQARFAVLYKRYPQVFIFDHKDGV